MELSVNFEKLYFAFILNKPEYFHRVEPFFFRSPEIQQVFTIIKTEYIANPTDGVPKIKRIVELVKLKDTKGLIKKEVLKALLSVNLDEYSPDGKDDSKHAWLEKRVQAWITFNTIQSGLAESIDYIRNIDQLDFNNVMDVASKIRSIIGTSSLTSFGQESLGSNFDDLDTHIQDDLTEKVTTGFDTLDEILNKGWDIKTLNVLMAETNAGKCASFETLIKIRNKRSGEIIDIPIGLYFDLIKNNKI